MQAVVAITRNGAGAIWRFASVRDAWLCPLVQDCDVVLRSAEHALQSYGYQGAEEYASLLERAHAQRDVVARVREWHGREDKEALEAARSVAARAWASLLAAAHGPPDDPAELVKLIVEDRRLMLGVVTKTRTEITMGQDAHEAAHKKVDTKAEKAPKTPKEPKATEAKVDGRTDPFRMHAEGVISFGRDQDGKHYSHENLPRRTEDAAKRFKIYRVGMTVQQALDAGLTRSDVRRDRRAGYIDIKNPPEKPAEKKAEKEAEAAA